MRCSDCPSSSSSELFIKVSIKPKQHVRNKKLPTIFWESDLNCLAFLYVFNASLCSLYLRLTCRRITANTNKFVAEVQVFLDTAIRFYRIKSVLNIMFNSKRGQILENSLDRLLLATWITCNGSSFLVFVLDLKPEVATNKTFSRTRIHPLIAQVFK